MSVTPMTLELAVGQSADVVVSGTTVPFELVADDAEYLMSWGPSAGVSVVHAGGVAQGALAPAPEADYSETFTITCDTDGPGSVDFDIQGGGSVLTMGTVTVECGADTGTTTGTTSTTTASVDDTGETGETGDPPLDLASLYCFDQFGNMLASVTLGDNPSVETEAFVGFVAIGAVAPGPPPVFYAGLFPERGDPALVSFEDWILDEPPTVAIPNDGPNLFRGACPSSAGVLFTGETTDSLICDFATGSCSEVTTPSPLNTCQCAGSDCVAAPLLNGDGFYQSTDGGQTFTPHAETYAPNELLGDGSGVMAFFDPLVGQMRVSDDSGATFTVPTLPTGLEAATPVGVAAGIIVAALPFEPGDLAVSSDGGQTFLAESFNEIPEQIVATTEGDLAAITSGGAIFVQTAPFDGVWSEVTDVTVPFASTCYGG